MARNKRVSLGGKNFFSLVVLSVAAIGLLFTANYAVQQQTSTQSEASGASGVSLNGCTNGRYVGGTKLYNGDGQTGGDRVLCIQNPNITQKSTIIDNLDNRTDVQNRNKYNDIWGNFQNKTESLKIRALGGCLVRVKLFSAYNAPNYSLLGTFELDRRNSTTNTKSFELPSNIDNKAKSIKLFANCPVKT